MYTTSGRHLLRATNHSYQDASAQLDRTRAFVKVANRGVLFAVADGVSQASRGGEAARFACVQLERFFKDPNVAPSIAGLRSLIEDIDAVVHAWPAAQGTSRSPGAAALTVAWLAPRKALVIAQLGDTAAFRLRSDAPERAVRLGPDQSLGHGLTHFVGQGRGEAHVHVASYPFDDGDTLVLVSDGVTKGLSESEIGRIVADARTEQEAAETLCRLARRQGSHDDITALVVYLEDWVAWQ